MPHRIPLSLKCTYTAFMAVLVPVYLHHYGPTNFLYVCDFALILTLIGIWTESALLLSMPLVGIGALQTLWIADYAVNLFGVSLTGMTDYMFEQNRPLYLRGLSLFHAWLPLLLVFLVFRTGYDRRAFAAWTATSWVLILVCYFFMPPPRRDPGLTPVNINYVWGPSDFAAQTWVPPVVWVAGLMLLVPLLAYLPAHLLLARLAPASPR
ncbi:MAG TPA: hypothetical protein VHA55_08985 [Pseudorhodoplanes sp.]|nr:hypothetical protein [Pseudorhodoplanes sp.]